MYTVPHLCQYLTFPTLIWDGAIDEIAKLAKHGQSRALPLHSIGEITENKITELSKFTVIWKRILVRMA